MTAPQNLDAQKAWLRMWAAVNKLVFEDEGEVGFGRKCVGIRDGQQYVDLGPPKEYKNPPHRSIWSPEVAEGAHAYDRESKIDYAPDAYHKHDCLAVLVHGGDYAKAIGQLYAWVQMIDQRGLVIKRADRQVDGALDLLFHGPTVTYLDVPS